MSRFALLAGAARVEITPDRPIPKSGFRLGPNAPTRAMDPLMARALVLKAGDQMVALVSVDLCAVNSAMTAAVRQAVQARVGLPPSHLLLTATHTHSAPDLMPFMFSGVEPGDIETFVSRVTRAVCTAAERLRPARLGFGDGHLPELGLNRRNKGLPMDPQVGVLRVDGEDGVPIAIGVNYACHPTMVGPTNPYYSADFPGYALPFIENAYGPETVALYLQGAAGDINTARFPFAEREEIIPLAYRKPGMAADSYDRDVLPLLQGKDWDWGKPADLRRAGRLLGGEVLRTSETIVTECDILLAARSVTVDLPLRTRAERVAYVAFTRGAPEFRDYWVERDQLLSEVQVLRIGPVTIVTLPGEPFVELGLQLKALAAPGAPIYVVGYANDDVRYILTPEAYAEGKYEVNACVLRPEATTILMETARQMIREAGELHL